VITSPAEISSVLGTALFATLQIMSFEVRSLSGLLFGGARMYEPDPRPWSTPGDERNEYGETIDGSLLTVDEDRAHDGVRISGGRRGQEDGGGRELHVEYV
jgi:hypothetical protein